MDFRNLSPLIIIIIISIIRGLLNSRKVSDKQREYKRRGIKKYNTLSETKEEDYDSGYQKKIDYSYYERKKEKFHKSYDSSEEKGTKTQPYRDETHDKEVITDINILINGVIMSEIIGAPRSKKPYIPLIKVNNKRA